MHLTAINPSRGRKATDDRAVFPQRVHLLGIAGSGMQSLARVLCERGHRLTGSDADTRLLPWLTDRGIAVSDDRSVDALPVDAQLVISSDAVPHDAPQLQKARRLGIPSRSYASALGALMSERVGLAVAGTHGKSTTTAMVAAILDAAQLDATIVVGASRIDGTPVARQGRGPHLLAEACEFRSNFLHLAPQHAVVLNIEPDHFDCFSTDEDLDLAFDAFMRRIPSDGHLIINGQCGRTMRLACGLARPLVTFGRSAENDWHVADIRLRSGCADFELLHARRSLGRVRLNVPGRHQVDNALAAAALAAAAGADDRAIVSGLEAFRSLMRRLQCLGEFAGMQFIDDYAHHPTEVAAALSAVRQMFPRRRLWCIFQPHQASRLTRLFDGFSTSLAVVDKLAVAETFRAREGACKPGESTARDLARRAASLGPDVLQVHALNDILEQVHDALRPGDVVLTLGAGDVGTVAHALIDWLRAHRAAG